MITKKRNRAKDYFKNDKELLRGRAKDKYRELSEEEKNIKWEYGKKRYCSVSEDNLKKIEEYQKSYHEAKIHALQMQLCQ